ncbi:MAG: NAD-dependent epimerase/dehydratase family protein [Gammaproteobacteria bacterium]|nr:NAD-dependent epimerase/dehydratase family protein [Gammaproteobacteria bacterium]
MKTLLTGGSGFVGAAVLRKLLDAGHEVRALVRPASDRRNLADLPVEVVTGDLNDAASLQRAVSGCSNLFHVAADYRLWVREPESIYRTNVQGTRHLMRAALEAGVSRVVYTSSVATLGISPDRRPATETTPAGEADMIGHYKRSKYLAERAVLDFVREAGAPIVIVNPSTPMGPRDIKPTPTGRIVLDMLRRRMPAYVETGLNVVHVDDVAEGHLLAHEKGKPGERYILGGENLSLKAILDAIAGISGVPAPGIRIPHDVVLPLAWSAEQFAKLTGVEPFATVDGIRMARKFMYFSHEKAARELGYNPRPAREAMAAAIAWFRENGYC